MAKVKGAVASCDDCTFDYDSGRIELCKVHGLAPRLLAFAESFLKEYEIASDVNQETGALVRAAKKLVKGTKVPQ